VTDCKCYTGCPRNNGANSYGSHYLHENKKKSSFKEIPKSDFFRSIRCLKFRRDFHKEHHISTSTGVSGVGLQNHTRSSNQCIYLSLVCDWWIQLRWDFYACPINAFNSLTIFLGYDTCLCGTLSVKGIA